MVLQEVSILKNISNVHILQLFGSFQGKNEVIGGKNLVTEKSKIGHEI